MLTLETNPTYLIEIGQECSANLKWNEKGQRVLCFITLLFISNRGFHNLRPQMNQTD